MTRRISGPRLGVCAAALAILALAVMPASESDAADGDPFPGMAGIDTSLALTDSAVTINGRGAFAGMEITVNQTENLTNQAISITWRGAPPTVSEPTTFFANFLQVMQCWGEPDDLVPENPGPPPEQCVWGALIPQGGQPAPGFAHAYATSRAFSNQFIPGADTSIGTADDFSGDIYRDFVAVDGTVVTDQVDAAATDPNQQFWLNPYFDAVKTNELPGVRTLGDGRGQALFTVNTGLESSGLGCGQRVQPNPGGQPTVPRCWLVIVPRGTPAMEQDGLPFPLDSGVVSSPMGPGPWRNRVAVELSFTPIDSPCDLQADQRRMNGSELALGAVSSWQPVLCTQPGLPPYAYGVSSDELARQQLMSDAPGAPGMVVVSRPLPAGASTADNPVVYAPLTASALTIGFHVERVSATGGGEPLAGVRYARMNLTPRLVAKLLTQSYRSQVDIDDANFLDFRASNPYEWDDGNPLVLFSDPDFLQFNPEFALWSVGSSRNAGGLILPAGTSDAASQLWDWVLADPESAAWLAGEPDGWGMVVNPVYATTAAHSSTGFPFGSPVPDSFPKSDPYCYQSPKVNIVEVPPLLCGLDWMPYASGLTETASRTALANDGSRVFLNMFAGSPHEVWKSTGTQQLGRRTMLGLTDTTAAHRFGLQTAHLSLPGDDGPDRRFIAPDGDGLRLAVASMSDEGGLLRLDPADTDPGAYPLTAVSYAAIRPLAHDAQAREQYAAFLDYAAGPGQQPGYELGQLPAGYLPLPAELAAATSAAADRVRTLTAPPAPAAPPTTVASGPEPGGSSFLFPSEPTFSTDGRLAAPDLSGAPPAAQAPGGDSEVGEPSGLVTPVAALGAGRFVVAAFAVVVLLSALGFVEITKRPRSGTSAAPSTSAAAAGPQR
ncbi:MAG: hypothetical protein ACOYXM_11385 [Actinomycetota bacterium]